MNEDTRMRWLLLGSFAAVLLAATFVLGSRKKSPPGSRARPAGARPGVWRPFGGAPARELDPFEVLRVQLRLGALADEVRALERNTNLYARGHHLKATQAAYDALLIEACELAGISTRPDPCARRTFSQGEQERFREEVELASRGWSW